MPKRTSPSATTTGRTPFRHDWSAAWSRYSAALDWWAGQDDLDTARTRYLDIVWQMSEPSWRAWHQHFYGQVPTDILENTLEIAVEPKDVAHAHCLLAMHLANQGGFYRSALVAHHFEKALALGENVKWHEMALFNFAQYMERHGRAVVTGPGRWQERPDFVRALELYRRFVEIYPKGRSRFHDHAISSIAGITAPTISVSVSTFFRPGMTVDYDLNWRNMTEITLALHRVDLVDDLTYPRKASHLGQWLSQVDLSKAEVVRQWKHLTGDTGIPRAGPCPRTHRAGSRSRMLRPDRHRRSLRDRRARSGPRHGPRGRGQVAR